MIAVLMIWTCKYKQYCLFVCFCFCFVGGGESCYVGLRWSLNRWVWRVIQLSWHWSGVSSTTEVPKERRVTTSLSRLCLLSAMGGPAGQLKCEVLSLGRVVWPLFGGKWVKFHWCPWRPATMSWIGCRLQQEASGGHRGGGSHERNWEDCKQGVLQHSGYAAMVKSQRMGVQPRGSCSSPGRRWPALGLGVALCLLWGKTGSCSCCRGQICRIGPQQWCWGLRTVRHQGLRLGNTLTCSTFTDRIMQGHSFPGMRRSSLLLW